LSTINDFDGKIGSKESAILKKYEEAGRYSNAARRMAGAEKVREGMGSSGQLTSDNTPHPANSVSPHTHFIKKEEGEQTSTMQKETEEGLV
jgi:hypothetical protein